MHIIKFTYLPEEQLREFNLLVRSMFLSIFFTCKLIFKEANESILGSK